jgi:hypothetical protein
MMSLNSVLPEPLARYLHQEIVLSLKNRMRCTYSQAEARAEEIMNAACDDTFALALMVSNGFVWRDSSVLPGLEQYGPQSPHYLWHSLAAVLAKGIKGDAVYSEMEAFYDGGTLPPGTLEPLIITEMGYNKTATIPLIL